jgi:hypothetical protein
LKNAISAMMAVGVLTIGMQAMADEAPQSTNSPSNQQFMKQCMTKARAANNGTSDQDMQKACKEQLKASAGEASEPVVPAH